MTEEAMRGYVIAAACGVGLTHDQIALLMEAMTAAMENMTEDEAINTYLTQDY